MALVFNNLYTHLADRASSIWSNDRVKPISKTNSSIKEIYLSFLQTLNYSPEKEIDDTNATYQSILSEFEAYNTGGTWFPALCNVAASLAETGFGHNSPEVRLRIARFSMYLLYVDDVGQRLPSLLEGFQKGVLEGDHSKGPFLQDFRQHLLDIYRFWDPIPANVISASGMEFVNGWLLEQAQEIRDMKISQKAKSWPYCLRTKTGAAGAYAFMIFPKDLNIDMSVYIQVLDDLCVFLNLVNDILSFYKEDLAGETNNYICIRAHVNQKPVEETLQNTVNETLEVHDRIADVLRSSSKAYATWTQFVNSYLAFHVNNKRYRLIDLGIL